MRKTFLLALLLSSIMASNLTVEVTNISNRKGKIAIGLYDNYNTFADISKCYKGVHLSINNKKATYTFKNIPNGTYAIAVIHDENENKKLDKNFFGIPKEGYGFSNNVRPTFRGATFDEAKFELNNDKNITIKILK